ncbi:UNVERIFIED_CONTAM: hypothetical protein K2H54_020837 [Gekko kuhli]
MAHNQVSGASFKRCPYFDELSRILHGRVSVMGRTLTHSIPEDAAPGTSQPSIPASLAEEEELFPVDAATSYIGHVVEGDRETPLTQEAEEGAEDEGNEGDMDDLPPLEGTSASTQIVECQSPPTTNPTDAEFPPAVVMGKLSPKSRLAYIRARTKRVSAVQRVGDKMLAESIRQHEAARQQHWELMQVFNASLEEERQSWEALTGVLQGTLAALNVLIRGNEGEGGTQPGGNSTSTQAQPPQGPLTVSSGDTVSGAEHQAAQPRGPAHVPMGDAGEGASPEGRVEVPIIIASSAGSGPGQMSPPADPGTCHDCAVLRRRLEAFETAVDNRFNQILGLINTLTEVVEGVRADVSLQGTVQPGAAGLPP